MLAEVSQSEYDSSLLDVLLHPEMCAFPLRRDIVPLVIEGALLPKGDKGDGVLVVQFTCYQRQPLISAAPSVLNALYISHLYRVETER